MSTTLAAPLHQGYFAPEVLALPLKSSPFEGKSPEEAANRPGYDCKVDVWSTGVVCFEVLTGRAPFAAENVAQVLQVCWDRGKKREQGGGKGGFRGSRMGEPSGRVRMHMGAREGPGPGI
jgi:serine/threonine protein kinase